MAMYLKVWSQGMLTGRVAMAWIAYFDREFDGRCTVVKRMLVVLRRWRQRLCQSGAQVRCRSKVTNDQVCSVLQLCSSYAHNQKKASNMLYHKQSLHTQGAVQLISTSVFDLSLYWMLFWRHAHPHLPYAPLYAHLLREYLLSGTRFFFL